MSWKPNEQGLAQVVGLIRESRTGANQQATLQLQQLAQWPDFDRCLAYIVTQLASESVDVRQVAGILLKNDLLNSQNQAPKDPQMLQQLQEVLIQGLMDPQPQIRAVIGSILTAIASAAQSNAAVMVTLLQNLLKAIESGELSTIDGAMNAFLKICEDCTDQLDSDALGRPLNLLIPRFIQLFNHPAASVRNSALGCLYPFLESREWPAALVNNIQLFLQGMNSLSNDQSPNIRRKMCQCFVVLLDHYQYIHPFMKNIIEFMLRETENPDESVALAACEFWFKIAETESCPNVTELLRPALPFLVPTLLKGMVYSEMDRIILGNEVDRETENVADRPEDIAPSKYFVHTKAHVPQHDAAATADQKQAQHHKDEGEGDENEDEDDIDDDHFEQDDEYASEWNLRKCAASSLDTLSHTFNDELLPVLLPHINERIQPANEWFVKESAVLAIGAVAEGCYSGMEIYLPQLVPYLLNTLDDPKPLVRSITAWTLSRYCDWVISNKELFERTLAELLKHVVDSNKRVQQAACSALANFEDSAGPKLVPYLRPILETFIVAFKKYQTKNLIILYDAVGSLADAAGPSLSQPLLINMLMKPLIDKWNALDDTDKNLFPLLECLTSVASAIGPAFSSFSVPVFKRCLTLIEHTIMGKAVAQHTNEEMPDSEFIVCALDLLSGMAEGMQAYIEDLVVNSNLLNLLFTCMNDNAPEVRQSAFSLVGDLAKACIKVLQPVLHEFIPVLSTNMLTTFTSVCNNAIWALGEIAVKVGGPTMEPYLDRILPKLISIMTTPEIPRSLHENTAITIGRLGWVCPNQVAPRLPEFTTNLCLHLREIRSDIEKEHTLRGLCAMIRVNPHGVLASFVFLCNAIASYNGPPDSQLYHEFHQILHGFKQSLGAQKWAQYVETFPEPLKKYLRQQYQL